MRILVALLSILAMSACSRTDIQPDFPDIHATNPVTDDGSASDGQDDAPLPAVCVPRITSPVANEIIGDGRFDICRDFGLVHYSWTGCEEATEYNVGFHTVGYAHSLTFSTAGTDYYAPYPKTASVDTQWYVQVQAKIDGVWGLSSDMVAYRFNVANVDTHAPWCSFSFICPVKKEGETFNGVARGCCSNVGSSFPKISPSNPLVAGMLIKAESNPTVYYYSSNGKRYAFPHEAVMVSWFETGERLFDIDNPVNALEVCSRTNELPDADLESIAYGGVVTLKPGTYAVKISTSPQLYVVSQGRVLLPLVSADLVKSFYPGIFEQKTWTIPDAVFSGYFIGARIDDASGYDPAAESAAADIEMEVRAM